MHVLVLVSLPGRTPVHCIAKGTEAVQSSCFFILLTPAAFGSPLQSERLLADEGHSPT